jgi:hypothetical protein
LKRRNYREETVSGIDFDPGKKNLTGGSGLSVGEEVRTSGALLSAGKRGRGDTLSGLAPGGPFLPLGQNVAPRPFSVFIILFFFSL